MHAKPPKFGNKLTIVFRIKILTLAPSHKHITMSAADGQPILKLQMGLLSRNDRNIASFQSLGIVRLGGKESSTSDRQHGHQHFRHSQPMAKK